MHMCKLFLFYRLGHSDVFNLIHQHNLFSSIQDKIIMLMEFDKEVHIETFFFCLCKHKSMKGSCSI